MDELALNYNPNANTNDASCLFTGCTNPDAVNYDSNASVDDGSCLIVGCTVNAWFVCNYNPEATLNDWSLCEFDFSGGCAQAVSINNSDTYPILYLSDITDDIVDAYYYLGDEKIGCMDKNASNYLATAVLDSESCIYSTGLLDPGIETGIKVYPQPASAFIFVELLDEAILNHNEFTIHNVLGEKIYTGKVNKYVNLKVNTSEWIPGIYYVVIKMENKNISHRFVIE